MVKMIKRSCEIMLAVVLVELWALAMRGRADFDVDDKRRLMRLRVGDERGRIDLIVVVEKGWMVVTWTRGIQGQQTFTCVMVNTQQDFGLAKLIEFKLEPPLYTLPVLPMCRIMSRQHREPMRKLSSI